MNLKPQDRGEKVLRPRFVEDDAAGHAGIEVGCAARRRGADSLVLLAQLPPGLVVAVRAHLAGEDPPAPLVDEQREGEGRNVVERLPEQERDVGGGRRRTFQQPRRDEPPGGDRERRRAAGGGEQDVAGAGPVQRVLRPVGPAIVGARDLAMRRDEAVAVDLEAHRDPHVVPAVDVPAARAAVDLAVRRPHEARAFPEGRRQRVEAEGAEEALGVPRHLRRVHAAALQLARQVVPAAAGARGDHAVHGGPVPGSQVSQQVRRNRLSGRRDGGAVFRAELGADQTVQRFVERPDFAPQPFELGAERLRRQVVGGPPPLARVRVAQLRRPGVRNLDQPLEARPHRGRQGPPFVPQVEQPIGVAQLGDRFLQRGPLEAVLAGAGAVRARGMGALQIREDVRQFLLRGRLAGCAGRKAGRAGRRRRLEPRELAGGRFRQVQPVEARGFPRQLGFGRRQRRGGQGGLRPHVAGGEVVLRPGGV